MLKIKPHFVSTPSAKEDEQQVSKTTTFIENSHQHSVRECVFSNLSNPLLLATIDNKPRLQIFDVSAKKNLTAPPPSSVSSSSSGLEEKEDLNPNEVDLNLLTPPSGGSKKVMIYDLAWQPPFDAHLALAMQYCNVAFADVRGGGKKLKYQILLKESDSNSCYSLSFNKDGSRLAACTFSRCAFILDTSKMNHQKKSTAVREEQQENEGDHEDDNKPVLLHKLEDSYNNFLYSVTFSSFDENILVVSDMSKKLVFFDIENEQEISSLDLNNVVYRVSCDPTLNLLFGAGAGPKIDVVDLETRKLVSEQKNISVKKVEVKDRGMNTTVIPNKKLVFAPGLGNGKVKVCRYTDGGVSVVDGEENEDCVQSWKRQGEEENSTDIYAIDSSGDGRFVAWASQDNRVFVFKIDSFDEALPVFLIAAKGTGRIGKLFAEEYVPFRLCVKFLC